jgi:hypothetical protein
MPDQAGAAKVRQLRGLDPGDIFDRFEDMGLF